VDSTEQAHPGWERCRPADLPRNMVAAGAHDGSVAEPSFCWVDHVDRPEDNALPHFIHGKTTRIHDFNVFNEYIYTFLYIYNTFIYICSIYRNCLILAAAKSAPPEWRLDKLSQSIFLLVK
jgi:hypothetical protein